ncbi:MAG: PxKF domain-containing protein, partial [Acidimicrobiia bacterium]
LTADTAGLTLTCSATSAGGTSSQTVTIYRDATAPGIVASRSPEPNSEGWNNTPVLVTFACTDLTSGVAVCGPDQTVSTEGAGQSVTGTATDHAGNSDTATVANIDIDLTAPAVSFAGGPVDGGVYYFGSVPAAPSCDATDTLSGVSAAGCGVSGYSSSVGVHTMTAAASDRAGNTTSVERTYTVLAWTLTGFYRPVDMPVTTLDMVYNTVKGGSTVPLKFEVFAGPTELTTTSTILSFGVVRLTCVSGASEDAIEVTTTGSTSLRYDSDSGQFVQNWQTPKTAGSCYKVTLVTQDGSTVIAYFKTK